MLNSFLSDLFMTFPSDPFLIVNPNRTMSTETISSDSEPDSESDQFKYKAAKRILQSRSLRFLLTEKNQYL